MSDETRSRRRPEADRPRRGSGRRPGRGRRPEARAESAPEPVREGELLAIIHFKGNRKGFYHNRRGVTVHEGQFVVVEADRGCDLGRIAYLGEGRPVWWDQAVHQGIMALASGADLDRIDELRREEREAWEIGLEKIQDHDLDMHLVGVERRWDRGKLTFYFLADGRVDFRALVRDLAGIFRTRIELRQIGVRDEARLKGGLGVCGREFCCSRFLPSFDSVTLRMAKSQQLPLNPAKLSGPCGRLRCCLAYEDGQYREVLRGMPRPGSPVSWQGQTGRVRKLDPLSETVVVQLDDTRDDPVRVPASELTFEKPDAGEGSPSPAEGDEQTARRTRRRRSRSPRRPGSESS